jgi:hypothetical protein
VLRAIGKELRVELPHLTLDTSAEPATVTGTLWLDSGIGFSVDLRIPDDYPEGIPRLICREEEIPGLRIAM